MAMRGTCSPPLLAAARGMAPRPPPHDVGARNPRTEPVGVSGIAVWSAGFRTDGLAAMKKKSAKAQRKAQRKQAAPASRGRTAPRGQPRRWSAEVTQRSDALDLEKGVFTRDDPKQIAASLKRSAEASRRKKTDSFRSALSMLNFYINRAGTNLSDMRRRILNRAKDELRRQFGRG